MTRTTTPTRALLALVATIALVAASCSTSTDSASDGEGDGTGEEVLLQGVDTVEIDPFTDSVATAQFASFPRATADAVAAALAGFEAAAGATRSIPGDTPGLYGGTGDEATCDLAQLNDFLADPANADKAGAFAQVLGIQRAGIADALDEYTTVVLGVDMLVTNHGFSDGSANPFDAVLQAGTAVAVDRHGVPRVKCGCGNPLAPAPAGLVIDADSTIVGETWPGWDPAQVARAEPTGAPVDDFELIDIDTGELYRAPAGGTGSGTDEDCATDADGHGPDCDPATDDQEPTTTPRTDPPATPMGEDPSTMEDSDSDPDDRSWGVTGGAANPDEEFRVECAPNGRFEAVYGSGPYEISSSVCTAAVHAGVITQADGGMVSIRAVDGAPMGGSTANGVTTEPTGNPRGFFDFT